MMPTKYIGLVLRARRKALLLSQTEIGKILDVATSKICMVENSQRTIALHRIQDYLEAYRLSSNCYPVFVKLLYPLEWEQQLVLKDN
jgi:transcriptional regulator with XRE-family HTH domain